MGLLSFLKAKGAIIGAAILAGLIATIKVLSMQNARNARRADRAEASLKFKQDVDIIDAEIEQEFSHMADLAQEALENDEIPEHLRKPRD